MIRIFPHWIKPDRPGYDSFALTAGILSAVYFQRDRLIRRDPDMHVVRNNVTANRAEFKIAYAEAADFTAMHPDRLLQRTDIIKTHDIFDQHADRRER